MADIDLEVSRLQNLSVRALDPVEIIDALPLIWEVFNSYEAPDYSQEGIDEFYNSIHNPDYLSTLRAFGAFENRKIVGVIATRNAGTHIALFFVLGEYQRKGIGKSLFQMVLKGCPSQKITVNSSPYAIPVYHKLGFYDTDREQSVNGLRFIPMEHKV